DRGSSATRDSLGRARFLRRAAILPRPAQPPPQRITNASAAYVRNRSKSLLASVFMGRRSAIGRRHGNEERLPSFRSEHWKVAPERARLRGTGKQHRIAMLSAWSHRSGDIVCHTGWSRAPPNLDQQSSSRVHYHAVRWSNLDVPLQLRRGVLSINVRYRARSAKTAPGRVLPFAPRETA